MGGGPDDEHRSAGSHGNPGKGLRQPVRRATPSSAPDRLRHLPGVNVASPFDLADPRTYAEWRARKLDERPLRADDLIVAVRDPRALTPAEHAALLARVHRCNMAIYQSPVTGDDPQVPRQLGAQFGLRQLDANWLSEEDGLSRISVHGTGTTVTYIPYTDRAIKWHTDGYYNPPERLIQGMLLHCVRNAPWGGENRLMDHELAYLHLRERDPEHIRALMQPDAMVIPERVDEQDGVRPPQAGPVFSVTAEGRLHMRYTARTRSIAWKADERTRAAVAALEDLLEHPPQSAVFRVHLEPGMGLLCNNVLHDRSAFRDDPQHPRLLYRARYLDRIRD
ncbi:MAG: TauD/TfdA family dioxygenase [Betaproteobacteria bacterium]|nr:TauD/TfdA family dioxygenase [Betaproteobacteria bacterium]